MAEPMHEQVDQGNKLGPSTSQNGKAIRLSSGVVVKSNGPAPDCWESDKASTSTVEDA